MTDITEILKMIGGFQSNLDKDFDTSLKAMSAASVSMKIIKTMTLDMKDYWDDQVLLIKKVALFCHFVNCVIFTANTDLGGGFIVKKLKFWS